VTIFVFMTFLKQRLGNNMSILYLALAYNLLIIIVKFSLAPASLYKANPTLVTGGALDISNFNSNWMIIGLMALGVFLMYWLVFTVLKYITISGVSKRIGLKSKKVRAKVNWVFVGIIVAFCIFTGGGALVFALLLPLIAFNASGPYIGYIFSTGYSVFIALALLAAVSCAGAMFVKTERETVINKNLPLLISVIWIGIGLLLIFHILWAVYLFVLTSLWPFKVITVTSK